MGKWFVKFFLTALFLCTTFLVSDNNAYACGVYQWVTSVAGGMSHSIALTEDGAVWSWGANQQYQLGLDSDVPEQAQPKKVEGISSIISVCAGYDFSIVLRSDGSVYFLGEGGDSSIYMVSGLVDIVAVAAGQADGLALDKDGRVWQWGIGEIPYQVPKLANVAAISTGGAHFLALTAAGEVWAWGANWSGQLGNNSKNDMAEPEKVKGLVNIICISAGYSHSLAVAHDGSLYAWGSNDYGQLGDLTTETRLAPVKAKNIDKACYAFAGNQTTIVLTAKNEIYAFGHGEYGQLGDGSSTVSQKKPVKVDTIGKPIHIAGGVYHNFYISEQGELYAWGRNKYHQLGTGKNANETQPAAVLSLVVNKRTYVTDVLSDASSWAISELFKLYKTNLLPPMLWGNYRDEVTRAEFAGLLVNIYEAVKGQMISLPASTILKVEFEDIKGHVYEKEIIKAFFIEMVSGVSNTSFNPNGKITRQEATKMICSFITLMEDFPLPQDLPGLTYYQDSHIISQWAAPFVAFAYENNIMQGSGGNFNPLQNLTREQTLAIVYRTMCKYEWI